MPTKPATTFTHATDAVFGSGPASGLATKIILPSPAQGFIPGTGVDAEHFNYPLNITGDWITDWLFLGTFAPDEDAHIVETDSVGLISSTRLSVGGSTDVALVPSVDITAKADGSAPSLLVDYTVAAGPNQALRVTRTSTISGSAVLIQSNDSSGNVLTVQSLGTNSGVGISVTANAGRGVLINSSDGNPAPLQLLGRDVPPAPSLGDIYIDDTTNQERLRVYHSSRFGSVWTTPEGFARAFGTDRTQSSTSAGGFGAKTSAVFVAADGLVSGATVHVRATCEVGQGAIGTALDLRLRDVTAGADVIASEAQTALVVSAAAVEGYVTMEADYTLPGSGARTFALEFQSNGVDTVYIRRASIEVTGQY